MRVLDVRDLLLGCGPHGGVVQRVGCELGCSQEGFEFLAEAGETRCVDGFAEAVEFERHCGWVGGDELVGGGFGIFCVR